MQVELFAPASGIRTVRWLHRLIRRTGDAVLRYINAEIGEFDVIFNSIEVIEFSPIEVIKQWRLDL